MSKKITRDGKRVARKARIRKKIYGTSECPRLSVFKSNRFISVQVIDDTKEVTLCAASSLERSLKTSLKAGANKEAAAKVGQLIAERAKAKKIDKIVFDRNGFIYTGVVKGLADAAREAGLSF